MCLARVRAIAKTHYAHIALTGILPTLTAEDLESSAMTNPAALSRVVERYPPPAV